MSDNRTTSAELDGGWATQGISRRNTYELVADSVLALIANGGLRPGDPIPTERELTATYGVGRSSVREALRMLESKGLIASRGKGAFVVAELANPLNSSLDLLLAIEEASYDELFEVRGILEGEAAALAAARRTQAQVRKMRTAIDQMEEGLSSERRFIDADLRFHLTVAEATKNRVLVHLMHAVRLLLLRSLSSSYQIPGSPARAIEMHQLILDAVERRRPEQARRLMQDHVSEVEQAIVRAARGAA